MAAAVIALESLVNENPDDYKRLVPSMVNILKQIIEHRLPKSYNYHKNPAPFIQIRILRILAILGRDDKAASEEMYAILEEVLRKADNNTNIGTAVVYEAVKVASSIYPRPHLLQQCATLVSRLLSSRNSNMKYMGSLAYSSFCRDSAFVLKIWWALKIKNLLQASTGWAKSLGAVLRLRMSIRARLLTASKTLTSRSRKLLWTCCTAWPTSRMST